MSQKGIGKLTGDKIFPKNNSLGEVADLIVEAANRKFLDSAAEMQYAALAGGVVTGEGNQFEKTYNIFLESFGPKKLQAIKTVRSLTGLGLRQSKYLVESGPYLIKKGVSEKESENLSRVFRSYGIQLKAIQNVEVVSAQPSRASEDKSPLRNLKDFLALHNDSIEEKLLKESRELLALLIDSVKENSIEESRELSAFLIDNVEENSIEESKLDLLSIQTMGLNPDEIPLTRVLPINLYLASGERSGEILSALSDFLISFDLIKAGESPPIISSFFKRLWFRTTSKETLDELKNKLKKMEDALEAQQIDKPKSEIDLNNAKAAEKLLTALSSDSKSIAMHVGNLLVLVVVDENGDKHSRVVTLSKDQIEMIQRDQSLLRKPELLLQHLNQKSLKIAKK